MNNNLPYQGTAETIMSALQTESRTGLSAEEVSKRQAKYGPNSLQEKAKVTIWQKILQQLADVMVIILIIACLISAFTGDAIEAAVILVVVVINAVLGVVQEGKAEKALEALQKMAAPHARVLRDGRQTMLPAEELVPGDIVMLEAGDIVPADMRLIESRNLKAEEASLTGESVPVEKNAEFETSENLGLGDRQNMLFSSTAITYGRGMGVVTDTGNNSEIGKIAAKLQGIEEEQTPLQKNLNRLGKMLAIICLVVCAVVFVEEVVVDHSPTGILEGFKTAVALAVAAIPEGLAAIVTIVLAIGMKRMADQNAIAKRLLAVETLGCVDVICADKTGTLTQNEMTVTRIYVGNDLYEVSGGGYNPQGKFTLNGNEATLTAPDVRLLEIGVLCNAAELVNEGEAWSILGDPTEGALLTAGAKAGITRDKLQADHRKLGELPFDSDRKMMSVFCDGYAEAPVVSLTKGAPDIVLERCNTEMTADGVKPLTAERKAAIAQANSAMASTALRVLAFAYHDHADLASGESTAEQAMTFVGLMGMIDPARPEAGEAITVCNEAGIRAVMITGDYKDTAAAIARDLGLLRPGDGIVTGAELDEMSDADLEKIVDRTSVYARVSPEHKVRIVAALRNQGHIASMTGDGVNDAPALKQADIGVAMGITGTEVAKGAADMILTDDNFATIVHAVKEGRIIYSNIRKFVGFLLSCNVAEILVIFITTMVMGVAPLEAIQLLWLNLITDSFPALALGREKGDADIMRLKPRSKSEQIINREMIGAILVQSVSIFAAVFIAFLIGQNNQLFGGQFGDLLEAKTMAFTTLIFAELLRAYSCRSERFNIWQIGFFSNKTMTGATLLSMALLLLVLYVPVLNVIFKTVPLDLLHWVIIIALGCVPFLAGEIYKLVFYRVKRAKSVKSK